MNKEQLNDLMTMEMGFGVKVPQQWFRRVDVERIVKAMLEPAETVCGEAYVVVGSLLSDLDQFDTERATKILDNLCEHRMVHDDVLPWASTEKRHLTITTHKGQCVAVTWQDDEHCILGIVWQAPAADEYPLRQYAPGQWGRFIWPSEESQPEPTAGERHDR
jgi:hypothetical protein